MPYTTRRLILRAACAALLLAASLHALTLKRHRPSRRPRRRPTSCRGTTSICPPPRSSINDPRFSWETHFGGDLDVADYVVGRSSILVDYEAVLGDEFRPFDPEPGELHARSVVVRARWRDRGRRRLPPRVAAFERPTETIRDCVERSWRACPAARIDPGIHDRCGGDAAQKSSRIHSSTTRGPAISI